MRKTDNTALAPENQERTRLLNLIRIELAGLTEEESEELLQWLRKKRQSA